MKNRIKKILLLLIGVLFIWSIITGFLIWNLGNGDYAKSSDCIIVLGAAVNGDKPSPVFEERINHAVTLYEKELSDKIIFTGGYGIEKEYSESSVGASFAIASGIKSDCILKEEVSRTTRQNLVEAKKIMDALEFKTAIIISDPLHLKRASKMALDLDILAVTSPTPTSRYRSLKTKLGFLVREIYFYNHYLVTGH